MFHKDEKPARSMNIKRIVLWLSIAVLAVMATAIGGGYAWYKTRISAVDPSSITLVEFTVEPGQSSSTIVANLAERGLIKSQSAFNLYLRLNSQRTGLQAGDYKLSKSMDVATIVTELSDGRVESRNFTILPGKRLDQIKTRMLDAGFEESEIDKALDESTFSDHPINTYKPAEASLEGYIYPETFQITDNTTAVEVVRRALDETYKRITPDLEAGLQEQGLSVKDAIILASIVEKEVSRPSDRPLVAQVFLKRLREGIELGSDVTYIYAAQVFGGRASPDLDNPYNTRIYAGLPPGPVSNFDISSLEALANPSDTEYLFFVSGDDGTTHFAYTFAEHNQNIANYCTTNCLLPDQRDDIVDL